MFYFSFGLREGTVRASRDGQGEACVDTWSDVLHWEKTQDGGAISAPENKATKTSTKNNSEDGLIDDSLETRT